MRNLLVILVVVGHATYYDIITPFGGIQYGMIMEEAGIQNTIFHSLASELTNFIYTFHMPVFIALSGSLFAIGKTIKASAFIIKKAKRLLIPFFVVWLCWNMPIKYLTGYYNGISMGRAFAQMIFPSCVYLWYLECLFCVFVLAYFICKQNEKAQMVIVTICWLVGLLIYRKYDQYHFWGDPLYYILWFYVGYRIEDIIEWCKTKRIWNPIFAAGLALFVILLYSGGIIWQNKVIGAICRYVVSPLFMLLAINYFARAIKGGRMQQIFSNYSFGIYLYAEPLNYWLLYEFSSRGGIAFFGTEIGAATIYLSRVVVTPVIAAGITWLLKKSKIKYLY